MKERGHLPTRCNLIDVFAALFVFMVLAWPLVALSQPLGGPPGHTQHPSADRDAAEKRAESGDSEAQFAFGYMLFEGIGGPPDEERARGFLEKSSAQGNGDATFMLGLMHGMGHGYQQNSQRAEELITLAASYGQPEAQRHVGEAMLRRGEYKTAFHWLHISAHRENLTAALTVAHMLRKGIGTEANVENSARWYAWAASRGSATGKFQLGVFLLEGTGTRASVEEAKKCFKLAAADGKPEGLTYLAATYASGNLGDGQEFEATKWAYIANKLGEATGSPELLRNLLPKISPADHDRLTKEGDEWIADFVKWRIERDQVTPKEVRPLEASFTFPPLRCFDRSERRY